MMTIRQIELKVVEFSKTGKDWQVQRGSDEWKSAVLLLAAYYTGGHEVTDLAAFTGFDAEWITERKERLEANGVWVAGQTYEQWFAPGGVVGFWADVLVAEGIVRRIPGEFGQIQWIGIEQ